MAGELLVDHPADGVVRLTISNPGKRNALDHGIRDAIAAQLARADDARCVVLTGAHGMFSSGYDLGGTPDEGLIAHPFDPALQALEATEVPTVCALNGHAIGGGLELAVACDLRVAADGVRLGMPPAKLGLVYSHIGLRRFVRAVGEPRTRELFLLGRTIDPATALAWGLLHRVVAPAAVETTSLGLAAELAANAPLALRGTKRVLRAVLEADAELDPGLEEELLAVRRASFASDELREGVRAFAEKRRPRWSG